MPSDDEETKERPRVEATPLDREKPGVLGGYYRPRRDDGRWYYSMQVMRPGDHRVRWYRVGYCREPCAGHETAEGARLHFRSYLLREQLRLNVPRGDSAGWAGCAMCERERKSVGWVARLLWHIPALGRLGLGKWISRRFGYITQRYAIVAGGALAWGLCPRHQSRDFVDKLLPQDIGELIG